MRDEEPTPSNSILPIFYGWMGVFFLKKTIFKNPLVNKRVDFVGFPPHRVVQAKGVGLIAHLMAPFRPALLAGSWSLGFFQMEKWIGLDRGYPKMVASPK